MPMLVPTNQATYNQMSQQRWQTSQPRKKRVAKSDYELVSKPFTGAQVRAIAAKKTREVGPEATQRYMHNLKKKTLKHHEQWGGSVAKAKSDDFSYERRGRKSGPARQTASYFKPDVTMEDLKGYAEHVPLPKGQRRHGHSRYDYEPGRQRRYGAAIAATGVGGAGLAGWGGHQIVSENFKSIYREPGKAELKAKPWFVPTGMYRVRRTRSPSKPALLKNPDLKPTKVKVKFHAKPKPLGAAVGGGLLLAGAHKLSQRARRNDREWY